MINKLYIIGVGPGTEDYLLPVARKEIEKADCLIGSRRLLKLFSHFKKQEIFLELGENFSYVLEFIKKNKTKKRIAVLVSGDPGIYSLRKKITANLKPKEYIVICGISTLQLAFAKIGQGWQDAKILSAHSGKIDNLVYEIQPYSKVFLLLGPKTSPDKIAYELLNHGLENRRAIVFENLSYPNERIIDTDLSRLCKIKKWRLCSMIIEARPQTTKKGKLYGVGIGPGDPKLITLKAKEILERADVIFLPKASDHGKSIARTIVEEVVEENKNFIELTFPMTKDKTILNKYWMSAAFRIASEVKKGKEVVFVTIGDPFIYSTYVYLLQTIGNNFKDIDVETIPGVAAFNAASARANFTLVEQNERLAIVPVTNDLTKVKQALLEFDTIVLMKIGEKLGSIIVLLKELGLIRNAILISRVGHQNEKIIRNLAALKDKTIGYLSVILVRKGFKK